jgi:hypothetical protein
MPSSTANMWMPPLKRLCCSAKQHWVAGRRVGLEKPKQNVLRKSRIGIALLAAALLAAAAVYTVPRAADAVSGLDDPARIAGRALDGTFDAVIAQREIEAALAAQDSELAQSVIDLAGVRHVAIDPALAEKVAAATAEAATMRYRAKSFARGLVTGEPQDMASLAGTTLGDLFVFGDIRDAVRQGTRYVRGEQVDQLVLGLAATGIAITAGTYVTFGAATPARAGLTLVKAARKTGRLGVEFTESLGRMVRQTSFPAATRAARDTAKVERAGGLLHLVRDVGRIEKAAGGRAALDALKIAKEPRDITRVAKLAEKEGSRTRAILKVAGRSAIMLAASAFDASLWLLGALLAVFGFVSAFKSAVERTALRIFRRRRERHMRKAMQQIAALPARG